MLSRKDPFFVNNMLCLIGGIGLILIFSILLFIYERDLPDYLTADKQTVTAEYVSSQKVSRRRNGRSRSEYRITRQYTINGEIYTYVSEESRNSTAPVETEVYLSKDGTYHARGRRTLVGDIVIIVLCLVAMVIGVFLVRVGLFKPRMPKPIPFDDTKGDL